MPDRAEDGRGDQGGIRSETRINLHEYLKDHEFHELYEFL